MRKYKYSNDLANCVKKYLDDDDWRFSFDENTGVFDFGLRIKSKIQKINYVVDVEEDEIVVYGLCPIGVDNNDGKMMAQMAEFFSRVNYGLKNGCFELDFRDGEIRFRSFIDCDAVMPSTKVIRNSIHCTAAMFKRYAPGIIDIIFSDSTAREAIVKCEKNSVDELRSMITEAADEDIEGNDVEEMITRLSTRFGITDDSEHEDDEDVGTSSDEIKENPFDARKEGGTE